MEMMVIEFIFKETTNIYNIDTFQLTSSFSY